MIKSDRGTSLLCPPSSHSHRPLSHLPSCSYIHSGSEHVILDIQGVDRGPPGHTHRDPSSPMWRRHEASGPTNPVTDGLFPLLRVPHSRVMFPPPSLSPSRLLPTRTTPSRGLFRGKDFLFGMGCQDQTALCPHFWKPSVILRVSNPWSSASVNGWGHN